LEAEITEKALIHCERGEIPVWREAVVEEDLNPSSERIVYPLS